MAQGSRKGAPGVENMAGEQQGKGHVQAFGGHLPSRGSDAAGDLGLQQSLDNEEYLQNPIRYVLELQG